MNRAASKLTAAVLCLFAITLLCIVAGYMYTRETGVPHELYSRALSIAVILLWLFIATWLSPRGKTPDAMQAHARTTSFALCVIVILQTVLILRENTVESSGFAIHMTGYSLLIIALGAVLYVGPGFLDATARRALNDEVTRSFRLRALQLGYFLLIVIFIAFCIAQQLHIENLMHLLPAALAMGVIVPTLYFLFLDWQASESA